MQTTTSSVLTIVPSDTSRRYSNLSLLIHVLRVDDKKKEPAATGGGVAVSDDTSATGSRPGETCAAHFLHGHEAVKATGHDHAFKNSVNATADNESRNPQWIQLISSLRQIENPQRIPHVKA